MCIVRLLFSIYTDLIHTLFTEIWYSEAGTNARIKEEAAFMYFIDYLDDCARGKALQHDSECVVLLCSILLVYFSSYCLNSHLLFYLIVESCQLDPEETVIVIGK